MRRGLHGPRLKRNGDSRCPLPLLRPVLPSAARDFVWEDCPRYPGATAPLESDTPPLWIGREENGESQPEFPLRGGPSGLRAASKGFALVAADKIGRKRPFRIRKRGIPTGIPSARCLCFVPCRRRQHGISSGRIARGIQGLQPPRKRHAAIVDRTGRKRGIPTGISSARRAGWTARGIQGLRPCRCE